MASRVNINVKKNPYGTQKIDTDTQVYPYRDIDYGVSDSVTYDQRVAEVISQESSGLPWEVTYFKQILQKNDEPALPDIGLSPELQRYERIDKLVLSVQSPIQQGEYVDITGEAFLNAGFMPLVHDIFMARIRQGRVGLFKIESIDKRTYSRQEVYSLSFRLYGYQDTNKEIFDNILLKSQEVKIYDNDTIGTNRKKIVNKSYYTLRKEVEGLIEEIFQHYYYLFYDKETKTFVNYLENSSKYLDLYLVDFVLNTFSVTECKELMKCDRYENFFFEADKITTLYNVLLNKNLRLEDTVRYYDVVSTKSLVHTHAYLTKRQRDYRYRLFDYILVPTGRNKAPVFYPLQEDKKDKDSPRTNKIIQLTADLNKYVELDEILTIDNHYVLGRPFYQELHDQMTYFEILTRSIVTKTFSSLRQKEEYLQKAIDDCYHWSRTDKFYCLPILVYILDHYKGFLNVQ